jgi:hypothetical protein
MRFFAFILGCGLLGCENEESAEEAAAAGSLTLDVPAAAAFTDEGSFTAKGTAENVASLTVNGKVARAPDGSWSSVVELERGVNVVEAVAETDGGTELFVRNAVLSGEFKSADDMVEDAIFLRVNKGGLRKIGDLAESMLTDDFVNESIAGMNPVYSDSYGVWGWDAVTVNANIDSITFDTPRFDFDPSDGELTLTVTLPNLYVDIYAWGDVVGFDFDSDVYLTASAAVLTAEVRIDTTSKGGLEVELGDVTVELQDFFFDVSLLPGEVEGDLLADTVRDTVEEMLVEKVEEMVPPLLDETLSGLDPSFSTELMGLAVDIEFQFGEADIDDDGLALVLDMDIAVPPTGKKVSAGFLGADLGTPDVSTHAEVAGAISDDLLNRVLFEAWAGGLLDLQLSTKDGSLEPIMLAPLGVQEGSIGINAKLPPVVVEREGKTQAQIGELEVKIHTPGGKLGDDLTVSVTVFCTLDVEIDGGELVLALGTPELTFMVRESSQPVSNETMTAVLEKALPIDSILLLLGDFAFPLPELYGIAIDEGTAERDDSGVYTAIEIGLK